MFNHYDLNVRPYLMPADISLVNTNTDLIFVFDDLLPTKILSELQNFDYGSLYWNTRPNHYTGGGTSKYTFRPGKLPYPQFLITTKKYIIEEFKKFFNEDVELDAVCTEFLLWSANNGASGQGIHTDAQELGPFWTILIHIAGLDGKTQFAKNANSDEIIHEVDFKPGRVILFPSIYSHKGQLPSDGDRYVLNSVVKLKNFSKSQRIFELTPEIYSKYADKMK